MTYNMGEIVSFPRANRPDGSSYYLLPNPEFLQKGIHTFAATSEKVDRFAPVSLLSSPPISVGFQSQEKQKEEIAKKVPKYRLTHKKVIVSYYQTHKEEIAKKVAKYQQDNKEKIRKRKAKYRLEHKKEIAQYYQTHKAAYAKRAAKNRQAYEEKMAEEALNEKIAK